MNSRSAAHALCGSLLLSGCATTHSTAVGELDPADFGEANRQTYAAMIVDPDPQYDGPMETSGEHAAQAAERYREDAVKEPETVRSTQSVSGGSGGAGSGS